MASTMTTPQWLNAIKPSATVVDPTFHSLDSYPGSPLGLSPFSHVNQTLEEIGYDAER